MSAEEKIIPEPKYSTLLSIDMKNLALAAVEASKAGKDSECYYDEKTNSLTVKFPEEFVRSPRRKFVKVLSFKFIQKRPDTSTKTNAIVMDPNLIYSAPSFYGLHADFVQDFQRLNLDNYICNSNELLNEPLCYEQYTTKPTFRLQIAEETTSKIFKTAANCFDLVTKEINYQANVRLLLVY